MKLVYSFFGICATVLMCWSCTTDATEDLGLGNGYVTLTLTTGSATRAGDASAASEQDYNEDKINRVDLFIFPGPGAATGAQRKYVTLEPGANGKTDISFRFDMDEFDKYFPGGDGSCYFYAFVNLSEAQIGELKNKPQDVYDDYQVTTNFKSVIVPADFVMTSGRQELKYNATSKAFTVNDNSNTTIKVTRLAAKIRMAVKMNYVYIGEDGVPMTPPSEDATEEEKAAFIASVRHTIIPSTKADGTPADMLLFIQDGVVRGQLSGEALTDDKLATKVDGKDGYYDVAVGSTVEQGARKLEKPGEGDRQAPDGYQFYNKVPYYSYPNEWENISSEEHNTMLTLQVKWEEHSGYIAEGSKPSGSDDVEPFDTWYSIPVNYSGNKLEANHYYRIKLHVTAVGSQSQHEPMEIGNAECEILEWAQSEDINVDIKDMRFLILEKNYYEMGSDDYIEIPYITSHTTDFSPYEEGFYTIKVSYKDLSQQTTELVVGSGASIQLKLNEKAGGHTYTDSQNKNSQNAAGEHIYSYTLDDANGILRFYHPLKVWNVPEGSEPSTANRFTYSDIDDDKNYTIEIKFAHKDMMTTEYEDEWTREVTITQGGSEITIEAEYRKIGSNLNVNGSIYHDMVSINGSQNATPISNYGYYPILFGNYGMTIDELKIGDKSRDLYLITLDGSIEKVASAERTFDRKKKITDSILKGETYDDWEYLDIPGTAPFVTQDNLKQVEQQRLAALKALDKTVQGYKIGDPRTTKININLGGNSAMQDAENKTPWSEETIYSSAGNDAGSFPAATSPTRNYNSDNNPGGLRVELITSSNVTMNTWTSSNHYAFGDLTYYYPTKEDEATANVAAPKFAVASQFGDIYPYKFTGPYQYDFSRGIPREAARRRCAVYQELQYPAGRWRLPTRAELEILAALVGKGQIMNIFPEDKPYWGADGIYQRTGANMNKISDGSGNAATAFVRCVYDAWYWPDYVSDYHKLNYYRQLFVWGDREKPEL